MEAKKLCESLGSEMVNIFVGKARQKFTIHKKLICASSKFFERAFNGGFVEAATGEINLPEDSSTTFECYIEWLYRSRVSFTHFEEGNILARLIDLYNFGDSKLCLGVRNSIMDSIQDYLYTGHFRYHRALNVEEITLAFQKTIGSPNSPIKLFFGHLLHWYMNQEVLRFNRWTLGNVSEFLAACPDAVPSFIRAQQDMFARSTMIIESEIDGAETVLSPLKRDDECHFGVCAFHIHVENKQCSTPAREYSDI